MIYRCRVAYTAIFLIGDLKLPCGIGTSDKSCRIIKQITYKVVKKLVHLSKHNL